MKEFTWRALLLGLVMCVILGAANAYLGLKSGVTIAATYPAAVIGMAVLRIWEADPSSRKTSARTAGSIGESVAAGAVFTLPAFFDLWCLVEFRSVAGLLEIHRADGGRQHHRRVVRVAGATRSSRGSIVTFPESLAAAEIHMSRAARSRGCSLPVLEYRRGRRRAIVGNLQSVCHR